MLLLAAMYGDTLVELLVGLTDCCVEVDTAGVHVMQRCCTGAGRPLWRCSQLLRRGCCCCS